MLHYRRVTQAERFRTVELAPADGALAAEIPADYADSPYPLQYFFELHTPEGSASRWPGLGPELDGQPYVVVRRGRS